MDESTSVLDLEMVGEIRCVMKGFMRDKLTMIYHNHKIGFVIGASADACCVSADTVFHKGCIFNGID